MATENKTEKTSIAVIITAVATLLTALGGLIYALKSPSQNTLPAPNNPVHLSENTEKTYYGNVGKLEATFNLTFINNSTSVKGTYFYDKKENQRYELSGTVTNGDLHLNEYTKGILTANCVLKKYDGCFSGKMFNKDGRVFVMNFCE